ncbi:hypothetical protein [Kitasatospora sp. NPDC017646]|uniref:hypothetical protein n=1 Tax=Kitasatospora sp. NPDC017646 TaxID=3364024 RepID=UPI0037A39877
MSRIGVYLAHPRPGSFNHALYGAVVDELRGRGCEVLAHDLPTEGFDPLNTSDTPETRERDEFGDPLERIRTACVLPYVGVTDVRRTVFRTVTDSPAAERAAWPRQAREQAAALLGRAGPGPARVPYRTSSATSWSPLSSPVGRKPSRA